MKIILFDIDGTLLVTNRAGSTAMHAALAEEFGIEQPAAVDFAGCTDRGIIGEFFEHHAVEASAENFGRFTAAYLHHLPVALATLQGHVLPGVTEILLLLRERSDVAVGLLTGNLEQGARRKLAHFELNDHFAFGGFGDRHPSRNEVAREAFTAAETFVATTVEPDSVIVVGDTVRDITCARSIGARVVAVATGSHSNEMLSEQRPDLLLNDLSDPTQLMALLES